jgi:hypothetical protein
MISNARSPMGTVTPSERNSRRPRSSSRRPHAYTKSRSAKAAAPLQISSESFRLFGHEQRTGKPPGTELINGAGGSVGKRLESTVRVHARTWLRADRSNESRGKRRWRPHARDGRLRTTAFFKVVQELAKDLRGVTP